MGFDTGLVSQSLKNLENIRFYLVKIATCQNKVVA